MKLFRPQLLLAVIRPGLGLGFASLGQSDHPGKRSDGPSPPAAIDASWADDLRPLRPRHPRALPCCPCCRSQHACPAKHRTSPSAKKPLFARDDKRLYIEGNTDNLRVVALESVNAPSDEARGASPLSLLPLWAPTALCWHPRASRSCQSCR